MNSSTSTLKLLVLSTESTTREQFQVSDTDHERRPIRANKRVENAVYAYIRAIRALGHTNINTIEIARALSVSVRK